MAKPSKSTVPKIRFKGFPNDWEDKPIGNVLSETKRTITLEDHRQYELITVKRRNGGVVSRGRLYGRQILVKNYSRLKAGDYLISKRQVVHGATGVVPPELDQTIVSNEYLVAVENSEISTAFLGIISTLPAMYQKFFLSSYGVDIEKLFFDVEDWKKRTVTIPKPSEQAAICTYFNELDRLIGLHQQKHEKLVTLKQAMLQKMFPQPGATTPEIRFKGFGGEWAKRTLGDLGKTISGVGFPEAEQGNSIGTPFFKVSDMNSPGNEHEMCLANNYVSEAQQSRKGWTPIRDVPGVLFAKVGAAVMLNRKRLITTPFLMDNNLMAFLFGMDLEMRFGKILFETIDLPRYAQTGALPSYNGDDIKRIVVRVPLITEQQKIGTYFRQIDGLISQHATQLTKLKNLKTACLERMFV